MDQLRRLIGEIHRRSLWQVLGIYVVASWVVLQVIETLTSLFTLPEWFPGFAVALLLIGLPVVMATAVVQEGVGGGSEGGGRTADAGPGDEPGRDSSEVPRTVFTWRNALLGGVAAFALWGVVAAGWLLVGTPRTGMGGGDVATPVRAEAAPRASLAVLPFETIGSDSESEMLAAGVHEDLLTRLSRIEDLLVIARTSVRRYRESDQPVREIAEELDVGTVLEGSVQQVGDRIRVTAQLIDGESEGHLWAESFDRELTDVFAIQSEIARHIAAELELQLSEEERAAREPADTEDPDAYRSYVRGRYFWNRRTEDGIRRAIEEFERALEIDPAYARGYAGLADAYVVLPYYSSASADEAFSRARAAAARALELSPTLAEPHTSLGMIRRDHQWDWDGAEEAFRQALRLNPGHATAHQWLGNTLAMTGRFDEAVEVLRVAARHDPLSSVIQENLALTLRWAGDPDAALDVARRAEELQEGSAVDVMLMALVSLGRGDEALILLEEGGARPGFRANALARLGREERARREAAEMAEAARRGEASAARTALAFAHLDPGEALDWLERAADQRDPWLTWVLADPALEPLHDEPRWPTLRERVFGRPTGGG